ncbi:hypothetical protein ASG63_02010 [Methylobacterium sp. Leaf94]|uniref:hypothetical protein n=1 Tax=Methylobacterium sp. Leaf94 TaxID=1736250 RepID=UPI0006F9A418|nr:hypothetical protein [Methylobacterium sp. Leaf94]KQU27429.1 hypothetical protein ASG63_02010 [Methylobacterium sp. Leaf94]
MIDAQAHRPNRLRGPVAILATSILPAGLAARAGSSDRVSRLDASGARLVPDARFATGCTPASRT